MKRKTLTLISIISIFIISLLLIGVTYGYYSNGIVDNKNEKSVEVAAGYSKVLFTDLSETETSNIIEPGYQVVKTFTVKNVEELKASYSIYLVNVVNDFVRTQDLTYNLYKKEGNITDVTLDTDFSTWTRVNSIENDIFPKSEYSIAANEIIENKNEIYTYALKIEYINHPEENQNSNQGKTFSFEINIKGATVYSDKEFAKETLAYNILNNAKNNRNGTQYLEKPITIVGEQAALPDEKILSTTEDDLGNKISYYFRGNVEDNYVNFAEMCWRIVRIQGNGSIKLILEDQYATCDSDSYTGNWSLGYSHWGYDYKVIDEENTEYDTWPDYFGFEAMSHKFKNFQQTRLTNYFSYLESGNWCLSEGYSKSLKCSGSILNEFLDNTPMYVGALTVDEVAFAGSIYLTNNEDVPEVLYLNSDYFIEEIDRGYEFDNQIYYAGGFWLSSLENPNAYFLNVNLYLDEDQVSSYGGNTFNLVRPSIVLSAETKFSDGTGIKTDPYIVE